jgi:hypothetical protein
MGRMIGTMTSYSFLTGLSLTNAYTYDAASNRTGFTDPESGSTMGPIVAQSGPVDPSRWLYRCRPCHRALAKKEEQN